MATSLELMRQATADLLYPSEKDAPFQVFAWKHAGAVTKKNICALAGLPADSPVELVEFGKFFAPLLKVQKWYGPQEQAKIKRYAALHAVLMESLQRPKVFKIGKTRLKIYIVGKLGPDEVGGVATEALET